MLFQKCPQDQAQLDAIGKYSMAILGWQHLDNMLDWTAVVYTQLTQAAIIKKNHPDLPVSVAGLRLRYAVAGAAHATF